MPDTILAKIKYKHAMKWQSYFANIITINSNNDHCELQILCIAIVQEFL